MIDNNIVKKIVSTANIDKETGVIEIGPGIGAMTEILAMNAGKVLCYEIDEDMVKIYAEASRIVFKSEKTITISRLLEGQFPQYNKLIPQESPKEAVVNVSQMISAIDRVSVMVNEKTSIAKFQFSENNLNLTADTPDSGKSEENIDIDYTNEDLTIAFNYKYMLEALKNIDSEEVKIGLNTSLSATVLRPNSEDDFVCLVMPVQIR